MKHKTTKETVHQQENVKKGGKYLVKNERYSDERQDDGRNIPPVRNISEWQPDVTVQCYGTA